jgi:hypothetical protein
MLQDESEFRWSCLAWFMRLNGNNVRMARGNHPQIVDGGIMVRLTRHYGVQVGRDIIEHRRLIYCAVYLKIV